MNKMEPIKQKSKIKEISNFLGSYDEKYKIMFLLGIYSGLRISDILPLKVKDVYDREHIDIREKKTGKAKRFMINKYLAKEINKYCIGKNPEEYLIKSRQGINKPIVRRRAYDVIKYAGFKAGLDNIGTHTMRKTFGYHYYRQTGDILTLQKILNHSTPRITLVYIGIEQDSIDDAIYNFEYK